MFKNLCADRSQLPQVVILSKFCVSHGKVINVSKTKFMVINGDSCDKHSLAIGDLVIQHCEMHVYLAGLNVYVSRESSYHFSRAHRRDELAAEQITHVFEY